jgi:hypothetical protein
MVKPGRRVRISREERIVPRTVQGGPSGSSEPMVASRLRSS